MTDRADFVFGAMRNAINELIEQELDDCVKQGKIKVHGLDAAQILALKGKFKRDTGLDPVKLAPDQIALDYDPGD